MSLQEFRSHCMAKSRAVHHEPDREAATVATQEAADFLYAELTQRGVNMDDKSNWEGTLIFVPNQKAFVEDADGTAAYFAGGLCHIWRRRGACWPANHRSWDPDAPWVEDREAALDLEKKLGDAA
jgi:hypothetical protein